MVFGESTGCSWRILVGEMTLETSTPGTTRFSHAMPRRWSACREERTEFELALRAAKSPLLICDYDGTLAPFQQDKMQAYPYPGIAERLREIAAGPTRVAFVSGRPVEELMILLPLARELEVWGMHGREHRSPDGGSRLIEPTEAQREALDHAQEKLENAGFRQWTERKIGSVALHWRTIEGPDAPPAHLEEVQRVAEQTFTAYAGKNALDLLPFDGGLELRATDHTKEHAVLALLAGTDTRAAAFLGDDTTDEDGFRAMRAHGGLPVLVREPPRPSFATVSLTPPLELLAFLDDWKQAVTRPGITPGPQEAFSR